MNAFLGDVKVADLVSSKNILIDVHASTEIGEVLNILNSKNILSIPVYGRAGSWVGAGGAELIVGERQYIGIVSVLDLVAFVFNRSAAASSSSSQNASTVITISSVQSALALSVSQAIGTTNESLSIWIEQADLEARVAMEQFGKGVHRALVLPTGTDLGQGSRTVVDAVKILTQTDILKFITDSRTETSSLKVFFDSSLQQLGMSSQLKYEPRDLVTVTSASSLISALEKMLEENVQAAPVVDEHSGEIVSTLSISDFRGVVASVLPSFLDLSVSDFLKRPDQLPGWPESIKLTEKELPAPFICNLDEPLGPIIDEMLRRRIHRTWVVNDQGQPTDAISFTDLIRLIYNAELETCS